MRKNLNTFLIVFPIFLIIIFVATFGLLNGFFEQDEWLAIANVMNSYTTSWWHIYIPWVHFSPLPLFIWSSLYKIFHLQAQYYFLIALMIHAACATLVFILSERITRNRSIAIIASLLFLLNGRAHQAFTHLAIFHTTTLAMFFILLFFVYLSNITSKVLSIKNALILALIFIATVATREEGFIIIPIAVAYLFCFDKNKINKKNIYPFGILMAGVIAFFCLRVFAQSLNTVPVPIKYQVTGVGAEYNLATVPIKFIVQNLVYSERIALFFVVNTEKLYPDVESFFTSHAPIMDTGFFYSFSMILVIFSFWIWYVRPKNIGKIIIFLSVWILANAFMLSFVGRQLSVIEPRYLYFSSFPVLLIVAIFIYTMFISNDKIRMVSLVKRISAIALFIVLLITSLQEIRVAVKRQVDDGIAKKKIFKSLLLVHPTLSKNAIFYVKCKNKCYSNIEDFGIPNENVLPFSSGPGMNFLVVYAVGQEKEWGTFFTREWLFHTFTEGYKKIGDRSFGYFVTKSKLEETLAKNKISKDVVVALEYNEDNFTFRDISKAFRQSLK